MKNLVKNQKVLYTEFVKKITEQEIKEYLATNPQITTDDIYISTFWNQKEFVMFFGSGALRNFHNLFVVSKNKKWCFSVCPFAAYPVAKLPNGQLCVAKKVGDKYYSVAELYHYKTAFKLFKIDEILFLHRPIVHNVKTFKDYWNKNRRQDEKELALIGQKIDAQDKISFGELVIAQNIINHLEHNDLKIYNYFEYRNRNRIKDEQHIKDN